MSDARKPSDRVRVETPRQFPWGKRGQRPVTVPMPSHQARAFRDAMPGAVSHWSGAAFSIDMVPTLSALGLDMAAVSSRVVEPIETTGMDEYRRHFAEKLRPYQKEMLSFLAHRAFAVNADPMRCLSGDTRVRVWSVSGEGGDSRSGSIVGVPAPQQCVTSQVLSLETLFRKRFSLAQSVRQLHLPSAVADEAGFSVQLNRLWAVHRNGRLPCFELRVSWPAVSGAVSGGSSKAASTPANAPTTAPVLTCTADHRILTPSGMKRLAQLRVGDEVCVGQELGPVNVTTVASITPVGLRETYDLTMESPLNNYLTADGFIVANSGKTPTTLAAATLVGAEKVLVVCPSIAKLVWATEIVKWLGASSLLLYGRAGDAAREFCATCAGSGVKDGLRCPDCRARNGQSLGSRLIGADGVEEALKRHRFIIANYDILIPQSIRSAAGVKSEREDLPGWSAALCVTKPSLVIADEAHLLRGRGARDRRGQSRRERLALVAQDVPRFWALTGTPIYGRVADLWALLDLITQGLFGNQWQFDAHFCEGHRGEYGWENSGSSNVEELKSRLDCFMLKRNRAQILPHLPPKTRQVIRIDPEKASFARVKGKHGTGGIHAALRITAKVKEPFVAEAAVEECAEGAKVVVYSYLRQSCEALAAAIVKLAESDVRLRVRNFRLWCVSGDTPVEARFKQAQAFREWEGAGVFVATIDSVPVAISLKGAQSVHFADVTFDPASLLQAEDRPYEVGTNGLAIVYYVVERSIDEHVTGLVVEKMRALEDVARESAAGDFRGAFNSKKALSEEEMADEIWSRMEAASEGAA